MEYWNNNKVFLIAEIGGNHLGDYKYAQDLLELAIDSGVDAVKFQIYTGDSLVNKVLDPNRNNHFKKFSLTQEEFLSLAENTQKAGLIFLASVWDIDQIDLFDPFLPIYKIGSGDITAYPLIKKIVSKQKPTILSTGISTLEEVIECIDFIKSFDPNFIKSKKLALLQCTSMYPIPDCDANLNSMKLLADKTGLPVGYSDHTVGDYAIQTAVAMGACIIEEHFTDNRENQDFRDHQVSLTKSEIINFINKVKQIKNLQGNYDKIIMPSEAHHRKSFRRGVYLNKDYPKGTFLTEDHLVVLRPCEGISANEYYNVIGKRLKNNMQALKQLNWTDLA